MDNNYKNPIDIANKKNKLGLAITVALASAVGYFGYIKTYEYSEKIKNSFSENFPYSQIERIVSQRHLNFLRDIKSGLSNVETSSSFKDITNTADISGIKFAYFIPKNKEVYDEDLFLGYVAQHLVKKTESKQEIIQPEFAQINNSYILYYSYPSFENSDFIGTYIVGYDASSFTQNIVKEFFSLNIEHFKLEQVMEEASTIIVANDYSQNSKEKSIDVNETNLRFTGWNKFNYSSYITNVSLQGAGYLMMILLIVGGYLSWRRKNTDKAKLEFQLYMEETKRFSNKKDLSYLLDVDPDSKSIFTQSYTKANPLVRKVSDKNKEAKSVQNTEVKEEKSSAENEAIETISLKINKNSLSIVNKPCPEIKSEKQIFDNSMQGWLFLFIKKFIEKHHLGEPLIFSFESKSGMDLSLDAIHNGLAEFSDFKVYEPYELQTLLGDKKQSETLIYIKGHTQSNSIDISLHSEKNYTFMENEIFELTPVDEFDLSENNIEPIELDVSLERYSRKVSLIEETTVYAVLQNENSRILLDNISNKHHFGVAYYENTTSLQHSMKKKPAKFGYELLSGGDFSLITSEGDRISKNHRNQVLLYMLSYHNKGKHFILDGNPDIISERILLDNNCSYSYNFKKSNNDDSTIILNDILNTDSIDRIIMIIGLSSHDATRLEKSYGVVRNYEKNITRTNQSLDMNGFINFEKNLLDSNKYYAVKNLNKIYINYDGTHYSLEDLGNSRYKVTLTTFKQANSKILEASLMKIIKEVRG